jgi:hypothetical protein
MPEAAIRHRRVEVATTILLAIAAVATAWSTYQSTQWRGEQAVDTSRATAARIQSSEASTRAGQLTQIDIATFTQWVNATVDRKAALAAFYRQRFRAEFQPAFTAWLAVKPLTNAKAPSTPFAMPQYHVAEAQRATHLDQQAAAASARASDANKRADGYMLAVVMFATALFFAGIATKVTSLRQREALAAVGLVLFVATAVWIATLPATFTR